MGVVSFFHTSILKRFYRTNAPHYTSIVMVKLLSNDQGRSSLNQCFQTFHIVAQVEIIIISWRKTGGSPQTTAGLEAVAVLSPHLTAPQAGEIPVLWPLWPLGRWALHIQGHWPKLCLAREELHCELFLLNLSQICFSFMCVYALG